MDKNRIRELEKLLSEADDTYYNGGRELMSNLEYDRLRSELESLTGEAHQKVGAPASVPYLEKTTHEFPAKSLDKTKDVCQFQRAFQTETALGPATLKPQAVLMWKLDGSTVQLTYGGGKLQTAATRGDGESGSVITHNARCIRGIPQSIPYKGKLVVRGEALMSYLDFENANWLLPDGVRYQNPRNLAAASIQVLDSSDIKDRGLAFKAFGLVYPTDGWDTFEGRLKFLEEQGFDVVEHHLVSITGLPEAMERMGREAANYEYPVDGLVAAHNDYWHFKNAKGTEHHPNQMLGYAFKWADELAETTIRDIEWSPSRTGLLNPVATFDPVRLEGTTVTRASLHNFSIMRRLHVRRGDRVSVYKANKIIPQIADNLSDNEMPYTDEEAMELVGTCPKCGTRGTLRRSDNGVEAVYCENPSCPGKLLYKLVHFCSRGCMNINGLSEETLKDLVDFGYVTCYADLYHLEPKRQWLSKLTGWGEASTNRLLESIEASRDTSFVPFVTALGIPGIGQAQAKTLSRFLNGSARRFLCGDDYDYSTLPGIGDVLNKNIHGWLSIYGMNADFDRKSTEVVDVFNELRFKGSKQPATTELPFVGKTFAATGKVAKFANRDELFGFIESRGGKCTGSVSSKTSYLVNNDPGSTSGKNQKARELGIPIITEDELLEMAGQRTSV